MLFRARAVEDQHAAILTMLLKAEQAGEPGLAAAVIATRLRLSKSVVRKYLHALRDRKAVAVYGATWFRTSSAVQCTG